MGNSLGRKKSVKIMKVDGTTFKVKPPAHAMNVLRDYPGYNLLESSEVKRLGLRAKPLDLAAPLKTGKLYFLVELPRLPEGGRRNPRRAWSGALQVSAKDRLESLMLTRRTMSDLTLVSKSSSSNTCSSAITAEEVNDGGVVRLRMRLPKAQVEKLMQDSKDAAEAAEKIMELCVPKDDSSPRKPPENTITAVKSGRVEKRTRFVAMPDEIIA